jgi:hypothetical protein
MDLRWAGAAVVSLGALACACGGKYGQSDRGVDPPVDTTSCDRNPDGACYPTEDVGTAARNGDVPGDRIPNFHFLGFPASPDGTVDPTAQPTVVSLADFYDPTGSRGTTILHIMTEEEWCGPANEDADFFSGANYTGWNTQGASFAKELAPLGVVVLQVLDDGPVVATAATLDDLVQWTTRHQNDMTTVLDPNTDMLGQIYDEPYDPVHIDVDTRSMEILDAVVGFNTAEDVVIKNWVDWTKNNPPRP